MDLAFKAYGDAGPPLVILHGLLGSGGNWHTLSRRAFAPHFRVFTVDLRNHGRSPHSDRFDYPAMVEDLVAFFDAHGLGAAHVLGHSMGGKVAMHIALEHPDRVDRLVVVDIAPKAYPARHLKLLDALRALDPTAYDSRNAIDQALATDVPDRAVRQFLLKNLGYDTERKQYAWQMNLDAIHARYAAVNTAIDPGPPFAGPALFVRGSRSDYVADDDLPDIRALFPQARLVTIDGAGHWVHAEQPDALAEAVLDFLR